MTHRDKASQKDKDKKQNKKKNKQTCDHKKQSSVVFNQTLYIYIYVYIYIYIYMREAGFKQKLERKNISSELLKLSFTCWWIYFDDTPNRLRLFHAERLGNCVHFKFIYTFLWNYLWRFFAHSYERSSISISFKKFAHNWMPSNISNTNNYMVSSNYFHLIIVISLQTQLYSFKYDLHTVIWYQLLSNTNNFIWLIDGTNSSNLFGPEKTME